MCGIAGILPNDRTVSGIAHDAVRGMMGRLTHRGPDADGSWIDERAGLVLGHQRLAIVELSSAGAQPMLSASARFCIVLNGEIYNYSELRHELLQQGVVFRGGSDTEVLIEAIALWGFQRTLNRLVGMFAFACWDRERQSLWLARDRTGEKPLYYGIASSGFAFASELTALTAWNGFASRIDTESLSLYLQLGYVPFGRSILEGIQKLPPASWLEIKAVNGSIQSSGPQVYWTLSASAEEGGKTPSSLIRDTADRLRTAVRSQMVADVPTGVFLSGGVDSSLVTALMQSQSSVPIRSFSIGFHDREFNEAVYAKAVADHLGTRHTEFCVSERDALKIVPDLGHIYDEPFADASQIPTVLLCRMARRDVTVALSGDGGDELFGGYNRYIWGPLVWHYKRRLPSFLWPLIGKSMGMLSEDSWNHIYQFSLGAVLPVTKRHRAIGEKIHKVARAFNARSAEQLYASLIATGQRGVGEMDPRLSMGSTLDRELPLPEMMMRRDFGNYLPDDVLVKVDRAAMSASLETRAPFLDHRVVEGAFSLPLGVKIRGNQGKWILRQILYDYVPKELIDRPKMGFGVPLASWLRGSLRDWAEDLISESALKNHGLLDTKAIRARWFDHQTGRSNDQAFLWTVLMFQSWYRAKRG